MEVEVADEVEDHLLPPPCLLREAVTLGGESTLYMESSVMNFGELVYFVFVFPKSYHS